MSELVPKGCTLADFPGFTNRSSSNAQKGGLIAGRFTEFSDDGLTLLAAVSGYPRISMQQEEEQATPVVSITPLVNISFDLMSATLLIYPVLPDKSALNTENLQEFLHDSGLCHGIDHDALEKAKRIIAAAAHEITEIRIAAGTLPEHGTNAYLEYALEVGPIAGLCLPDGSIDFRERRIMVGVKAGEIIATKVPAVPGKPGINVLGEQIEPRNGNDIKIITQGDVRYFEESLSVKATGDGVLSIVKNNTIKVSSKQKIDGNIDFNTGNIDSQGCLTITGSVQAGFKVKSGGDLKIEGSIMSAEVSCGGNCVVNGGITGKGSGLIVSGDADITFIERSALSAGGIVVIRTQAYFSQISSQADVRCNPTSIVMAGSLIAAGNLTLGTVGSEDSEPATVGAGIDPERVRQYRELRQNLTDQQDQLIQWIQLHGRAQSRKVRKMEGEIEETRAQLVAFNLIPGTELFSRLGSGSSRDEIDEQNSLYHTGLDVESIRIDLHGSAYSGTRILLGNRSLVLEQEVSRRQFKLSRDMKRIIALPLRSN